MPCDQLVSFPTRLKRGAIGPPLWHASQGLFPLEELPMSQQPPGRFGAGFNVLSISLSASVPLRTLEIIRAGGPTEEDYERIRSYTDDLTTNGADLFFRSPVKDASAERFNQVTD